MIARNADIKRKPFGVRGVSGELLSTHTSIWAATNAHFRFPKSQVCFRVSKGNWIPVEEAPIYSRLLGEEKGCMYEINVSKDGRHFFATHERSITDPAKLRDVLWVIGQKFPESEGYQISVTKEIRGGEYLGPDTLKEMGMTVPNLYVPR